MIRYSYFRFFFCKLKTGKPEKHHVFYIPSFRFSFSDSIMENGNGVIKIPFPFSLSKNIKRYIGIWSVILILIFHSQHQKYIGIWSVIPIFIFHSQHQNRKKNRKNNPFCICRPFLSRLVSFSWVNKKGTKASSVRFPFNNYQKA